MDCHSGSAGHVSRRHFLQGSLAVAGVGLLSSCGVQTPWSRPPAKVPRVGVLVRSVASIPNPWLEALQQGLHDLGYVEGQNIILERRWAEEQEERFPDLAAELVSLNVDVIVGDSAPTITAAKQATTTIPIVMAYSADPVGLGFATSLNRPGGNITGLTLFLPELGNKRVQLLRDAAPGWSRLALVTTPSNPANGLAYRQTDEAARMLGVERMSVELQRPPVDTIAVGLEALRSGGAEAMVTLCDPITSSRRKTVVDLAAAAGLPSMFETRDYVEDGGLIGYGPDVRESFRRAAAYVGKILKGASPAELPIEIPIRFDLAINLSTARTLGLTIPQTILSQAIHIIQ